MTKDELISTHTNTRRTWAFSKPHSMAFSSKKGGKVRTMRSSTRSRKRSMQVQCPASVRSTFQLSSKRSMRCTTASTTKRKPSRTRTRSEKNALHIFHKAIHSEDRPTGTKEAGRRGYAWAVERSEQARANFSAPRGRAVEQTVRWCLPHQRRHPRSR